MIHLELSDYEARALKNAAVFMRQVLDDAGLVCGCIPDGHTIPPVESAVLKIEVALIAEGIEV